jgi:hypothetical protein
MQPNEFGNGEDNKTVSILGTVYTIFIRDFETDPVFDKNSFDGYCDGYGKSIVVCRLQTYPGWQDEPAETLEVAQRATVRHEIIHAFLHESGLAENSARYTSGWAKNEEMVDWIALQGPKIYRAWAEAGALDVPGVTANDF